MDIKSRTFEPKLNHLLEEIINEELKLDRRGLHLVIHKSDVTGKVPASIKVNCTLNFFEKGSPFCCNDPNCHLWLFEDELQDISEILRNKLKLQSSIKLEISNIETLIHTDVVFDDEVRQITPFKPDNLNAVDSLGRTALLRAVQRDYINQVRYLLAKGANPQIENNANHSVISILKSGKLTLPMEQAIEEGLSRQ